MYDKFDDGLHPDDNLLKDWGAIISKRIDTNFSMSMEDGSDARSTCKRKWEPPASEVDGKREWKTY